ncbi:hypothetical protein M3G03_11145 [Aestuariimicrobium sp. p3-SID1156]|uniref:hypothetical protein n=1 Tax=Aestuariimicrobium sp. p3-SID1156 TaxID=2916038 RepID=UPI00223BF996|nr:hypothetical protein [Aestuariimicrobium sp. p3-SID1156]MCT1460083.1 hypothetical protein [Aestuariimicrobium sp. p3-SID1156]
MREFVFSAAGANKLTRGLFNVLRDRALELPDGATTREQFLTTRLVETSPGVVKLANPVGHHDDIPTTVGMLVAELADSPVGGRLDRLRHRHRPLALPTSVPTKRRPSVGSPFHMAEIRARARNAPTLPGGACPILGVTGAWDDPRRRDGI